MPSDAALPDVEPFPDPPSGARVALATVAVLGSLALAGLGLATGFGLAGSPAGSSSANGDAAKVAASRAGHGGEDTSSSGGSGGAAATTTTTEAPAPEPPAAHASIKAPATLPDSGIGVIDGEELVLTDLAGTVLARAQVGPGVYPHGAGRPWLAALDHGNVVLDEASGRISPAKGGFAKDCIDPQAGGAITVARCGPAEPGSPGGSRIDIDTGDGRGTHLLIAAPPVAAGRDVVGHWAAALPSPDGKWVLAQWSGECEVPVAFFVEPATGAPRTVTGEQGVNWTKASNSLAAGWTPEGKAVVALPNKPACGSGTGAGVYLVKPPTTKQRVFRSKTDSPNVFLWARKVAPKWDTPPAAPAADGTIDVAGFNRFVADQRPGWATAADTLAAAFTQADRKPTNNEPAPTTSVARRADGAVEVTVTFDDLVDDSIRTRRTLVVVGPPSPTHSGSLALVEARASWRCQPNRGHQTFSTAPCV
ncbi:MAG: hypothetical protein QOF60_2178 [Actinomycetota bacterium]|nr:hypothetical protein [Actinomycetota bacterium]